MNTQTSLSGRSNDLGNASVVVDVLFVSTLNLCALWGFRAAFGGVAFVASGAIGVATAVSVGWLCLRLRWSWPVTIAAFAAAFLLVGPVAAVRTRAPLGFLPSPGAVGAVVGGSVHGWWQLVTTLTPAGGIGNLLAVPYFAGFSSAAVSVVVAWRSRRAALAAIPPFVVLASAVLVGTHRSPSLLVETGLLGTAALAWAGVLIRRHRHLIGGRRHRSGLAGAAAMLTAVALVSGVVGGHLPFAAAHERYVWRDHVTPPFDPREYPSPLIDLRKYKTQEKSAVLFTVRNLPAGTRLRLAVMDAYDGYVWNVSAANGAGGFQRVGSAIPTASPGEEARIIVTMNPSSRLSSVWLPLAGSPTSISFSGSSGASIKTSLRYSRAIGTGATPGFLSKSYTETFVVPPPPPTMLAALPADPAVDLPTPVGVAAVQAKAAEITTGATTAYAKALALQRFFKKGYYNDGNGSAAVAPGHGLGRLTRGFLETQPLVGDYEQYAAAMALLARALGLPARVVLGFAPHGDAAQPLAVHGSDVKAWVEIAFEGAGWIPFDPTPDETRTNPPQPPPPPATNNQPTPLPPTPPVPANITSGDSLAGVNKPVIPPVIPRPPHTHHHWLAGVLVLALKAASVPIALAGFPILLILVLKARRRRRRARGSGATRISGAWYEATDLLRDLGYPVAQASTRREIASLNASSDLARLAVRVDSLVFAAAEPQPRDADAVWSEWRATRHSLLAKLGPTEKMRAVLSVTSLRVSK